MEAAPARVPARVCKRLGGRRPSPGAARDAVGKEKAERQKGRREGESGGSGEARQQGAGRTEEEEEEQEPEQEVEEGGGTPSSARQPAGPRAGGLGARGRDHVPALARAGRRHPAPPAAGPAAGRPKRPCVGGGGWVSRPRSPAGCWLAAGRGSRRGAGGFTCCQDLHYGLHSSGPRRRP